MRLQKPFTIILLILFYAISQHAFANTTLQDSIPKFDKEVFTASLQELAPKEFARLFTQVHDQDSIRAISCIEYARNSMITSKNLDVQFWGYYCLAHWENYKTNYEASVVYVKKGTEAAVKFNNSDLLLYAYILEGSYYYDYSKYKESMQSYLKAIKLAKTVKDIGRQLAISLNIALLKIEVGDNKGAIDLLQETLKILKEEHKGKFKLLEVSLYIALTKSSMRAEEYDEALYYGLKGIELSNLCNDEDGKVYLDNYLGETNIALGNYTEASELLDKAWEKANELESAKSQLPLINLNRAKIYYHRGDYKKAIDILEKVEDEQQLKNTNFFSLEDMYKVLGKSYKTIDTEKSLYYFEKANEVYNINDKRQNEIGVEIIKKYDLQSLKEELTISKEKSKSKSAWLYVSTCLMFVLAISFGVFYKQREKQNKKKFRELLSTSRILNKDSKNTGILITESENEKNDISELIALDILKKLKDFENKNIYLDNDITLANVASKLDTNPKYLSKTINKYKSKSFVNYIKDLRMDYLIDRLEDDKKFRSYTIEAIAKEIGYNRSETFSKAFRSKTGIYPSYFIKELNNQFMD